MTIKLKIAVLTSSRADYGIYLPLLRRLQVDPYFDLHIIAFGTHLSRLHGHTIDQIEKEGYSIDYKVETVPESDSEEAISASMATTIQKFGSIWAKEKDNYDLIFCLGDRYEMFAAVASSVPFNIKLAHIHGGETTLGAIDNKFRHCLSLFSELHFVATEAFADRVSVIIGSTGHIYNVGSLSLDNLNDIKLLSKDEFKKQFNIDIEKPTVLVTFHPETVSVDKNLDHVRELIAALNELDEQIIITMPNADTMGNSLRKEYEVFAASKPNVICIENFGTKGYFSCMKYAKYLLGNTSSGIIEAASFGKYVINVGDRQKGRAVSNNIIQTNSEKSSILAACKKADELGEYNGDNIYFSGNAADQIIKVLKKYFKKH